MYLSYRQFCVRLAASTAVAPGGPAERHPSFCSSTCISQHAMTLRWAGHCRGGGQNGHWVMGSACGRESQGKARRACFLASLPACLVDKHDGTEEGPTPARATVMGSQAQGTIVCSNIYCSAYSGYSQLLRLPSNAAFVPFAPPLLFPHLSNGRLALE
jgi:hypothetical protein